jgi:hypothetical protein
MNRGILRPDSAASPSTQWIYSSVSKTSLQKTGVFLDSARDFREFLAEKVQTPVSGDSRRQEKLAFGGLSRQEKEILSKQQWLAGDAVLIAPVSG